MFRSDGTDLDWTYVCPPTGIAPGERTGVYRVGVDRLLVDEQGQSTVSAEDFAVGVADLLESGGHMRERVTIAYSPARLEHLAESLRCHTVPSA